MRVEYSKSGFTIVELLIVIVVIAILAAISIISYVGIREKSINVQVASDMKQTATSLELFHEQNGRYPANSAELTRVVRPKQGGSYQVHSNTFTYCYNPDTDRAAIGAVSSTGVAYVASLGGVRQTTGWGQGTVQNICPTNIGIEMSSTSTPRWAWVRPGSNPPTWSF